MHIISFVRGALFGAFVMYLFAPRSGEETRKMLVQKGDDLKNTLQDTLSDFTSTGSNSNDQWQDEEDSRPSISGNMYGSAVVRDSDQAF